MKTAGIMRGFLLTAVACLMAASSGCQRASEASKQTGATRPDQATAKGPAAASHGNSTGPSGTPGQNDPPAEVADKPRDLGPPLADDQKALTRLDPVQPVWIDAKRKQVILQGETCKATYPLEFFATTPGREYEAVVVVRVKPSIVHAGLLAVGAKPGTPVRWEPYYQPPTGTEVVIDVRWKDRQGKQHEVPARQWIRNIRTGQTLDVNWVFVGSGWGKDHETGRRRYLGDDGDFITVLNLTSAVLDLPIPGRGALEDRSFEGFTENMPPGGTPVTLVLKPKVAREGGMKDEG